MSEVWDTHASQHNTSVEQCTYTADQVAEWMPDTFKRVGGGKAAR